MRNLPLQISVIGAGVVGATYAWQLAEAGHRVQVVARPRRRRLLHEGLAIACLDQRRRVAVQLAHFRPDLRADLDADQPPDLVLVCVQRHQREQLLPALAALPETTTTLFLQQHWDDRASIERWLAPGRYLLGAPAIGGGRDSAGVFCWLLPESTLIGTPDGRPRPDLHRAIRALRAARLTVQPTAGLPDLLAARAVVRAVLAASALKAGSIGALAGCQGLLAEAALAIREGLAVCEARDLHVRDHRYARTYDLRLAEIVRALGRSLGRSRVRAALGACLAHTLGELRGILDDILAAGRQTGVATESLAMLRPWLGMLPAIERFVRQQPETDLLPRTRCAAACQEGCPLQPALAAD